MDLSGFVWSSARMSRSLSCTNYGSRVRRDHFGNDDNDDDDDAATSATSRATSDAKPTPYTTSQIGTIGIVRQPRHATIPRGPRWVATHQTPAVLL
jgi:hypothetical protein